MGKTLMKRYQFFGKSGVEWTNWFATLSTDEEKWQIKNKLKNEYKTVES